MLYFVYSVFDRASGVYDRPVPAHSDDTAIRSFQDAANNENTLISKHPEDFTLFRVGTWDDTSGELVPTAPQKVIAAHELLSGQQKVDGDQLAAFDKALSPGGTA